MASSSLFRKISGAILSRHRPLSPLSFCTKSFSSTDFGSELDLPDCTPDSPESDLPYSTPNSPPQNRHRPNGDRPLEDGLDLGIYKAILVGQVGQAPIQKRLRSGKTVTLISLGTGGIRNNRRPLDNEEPRDYANRCAVQWHRVSVYPERLGELVAKNLAPGSTVYVEGNLETKIFNDPITGLVRRIREIAVRRNGRILVLGSGGEGDKFSRADMAGVGYY